jgi:hypothetical protein
MVHFSVQGLFLSAGLFTGQQQSPEGINKKMLVSQMW